MLNDRAMICINFLNSYWLGQATGFGNTSRGSSIIIVTINVEDDSSCSLNFNYFFDLISFFQQSNTYKSLFNGSHWTPFDETYYLKFHYHPQKNREKKRLACFVVSLLNHVDYITIGRNRSEKSPIYSSKRLK